MPAEAVAGAAADTGAERKAGVPAGAWGAAGLLAGLHASAFGDRFLIALVGAPLSRDLHLSDTQFGLLQGTCFVLLYLVATPVFGRLADRVAPRRVILAGLCVWTAATFALAFVHSFAGAAATRLLLGLGEAALTPAALTLIAARAPDGRLGRALSVFTSGSTLGKGLALFLGGAVLAALTRRLAGTGAVPWRLLLQLSILPNLLLAAALVRGGGQAPAARARPPLRAVMTHIGQRGTNYLRLTLASGATVLLSQTLAAWTPQLFARGFGLSPATAGMLTGAALILFAPAGSLVGGAALDRLAARRGAREAPLRLIGAAQLATAAFALALTGPNLALSAMGYAAMLLCLGAAAPAALAQLKALSPEGMRGSVASLYLAVVTLIGFGIGPPVVGLMSDRLFGPGRHLAPALLAFVEIACAVGLAGLAVPAGRQAPPETPPETPLGRLSRPG